MTSALASIFIDLLEPTIVSASAFMVLLSMILAAAVAVSLRVFAASMTPFMEVTKLFRLA
ncbi:hypothetical protein [Campylobacter hyointestinalis]|uniref:hypothetical protein n=1 Tax=Campylobacter hyointestinalis TaxID=198 RepID=UPI00255236F6|nr:hypothetical protein [Campylobacter hyointestinalis]MDL2348366.1 hypothetical protein [Campylobacter hyointestinalis]